MGGVCEPGHPRMEMFQYLDEMERIVFLCKAVHRGEDWRQPEPGGNEKN